MEIIKLNKIDSTHSYLKEHIRKTSYIKPVCVYTNFQTDGIGSRGNSWTGKEGNLFFSFVIHKKDLVDDLPIQSASIYFSFLLKQVLEENNSKVWLKWPNDFYIENKKIGGTITTLSNELVYCGIGLNLLKVDDEFGSLDIKLDSAKILRDYFDKLEKNIKWKQLFSDFKIEFGNSRKFQATINNKKISLENAILNDDGSVELNNEKVFSLR